MKKASLGDRGWEKRGRGKDESGEVGRKERKYYKMDFVKPQSEVCAATIIEQEVTGEFSFH